MRQFEATFYNSGQVWIGKRVAKRFGIDKYTKYNILGLHPDKIIVEFNNEEYCNEIPVNKTGYQLWLGNKFNKRGWGDRGRLLFYQTPDMTNVFYVKITE